MTDAFICTLLGSRDDFTSVLILRSIFYSVLSLIECVEPYEKKINSIYSSSTLKNMIHSFNYFNFSYAESKCTTMVPRRGKDIFQQGQ